MSGRRVSETRRLWVHNGTKKFWVLYTIPWNRSCRISFVKCLLKAPKMTGNSSIVRLKHNVLDVFPYHYSTTKSRHNLHNICVESSIRYFYPSYLLERSSRYKEGHSDVFFVSYSRVSLSSSTLIGSMTRKKFIIRFR